MFKVYYTIDNTPYSENYDNLTTALDAAAFHRSFGDRRFVTMVSENPDCTSLPGVDSVKDGILPNGAEYGYVKRRYK